MIDNKILEQLACECIDIFRKFYIDDWYGIILPDKYYDSLYGWRNIKLDVKKYCWFKWNVENIYEDGFNMLCQSEVYYMFNESPEELYKVMGEDAKRLINCYRLLRRVFRRYGLEWDIFENDIITFKKVG